jgi:hypothetical protein
LSHRICTGLPPRKLGKLVEELAQPWLAQQESRLRDRRGRDRLRAEGAGPGDKLPFADRVIMTLVILRFQLPYAALAPSARRAPDKYLYTHHERPPGRVRR